MSEFDTDRPMPTTQAEAYSAGWRACMAGCDARYMPESSSGGPLSEDVRYAWIAGFNDAMEAEDDEEPEPDAAGFGEK
jgi:hypothetical protein